MRLLDCALCALVSVTVSCRFLPPELAGLRFYVAEYEADIDTWFGSHVLQAAPNLNTTVVPLGYKAPRFEPGKYTASLDQKTPDFFDGELTVTVTGRRVWEAHSPNKKPKIQEDTFTAVVTLDADPSGPALFKSTIKDFRTDPTAVGAAFKAAVKTEMTDLIEEWLDEVEQKLIQTFANENPPPKLDGAWVMVQADIDYEFYTETVIDPETHEEKEVRRPKEVVLDRWVLFMARQVP